MNIDTKYIIRWGIPGWVFILFSYTSYISVDINSDKSIFIKNFTIPQLLGILVALGFIGIVLGYLMHQIYFSLNWIFSNQSSKIMGTMRGLIQSKEVFASQEQEKNTHEDYYMMEFHWHKYLLLLDEDKREYVARRYSYLLGTIHGLGALLVSISASFISVLVISYNHTLSGLMILELV
ncbi:hypothetical protein [Bacillus thermotolerans]|uniref:hypothetical protein n=1 Tax=Bacillus thermotolerans TaxID=1221996 RepID=UPI000617387C|nr:hypothetical protein [Bacillus thermotolerans]